MVAHIKTVAFSGIVAQCFILCTVFLFLLMLPTNHACADWVSKRAALSCDVENNKALIRFGIINNSEDNSLVNGPVLKGDLDAKYAYLAQNKIVPECIFSDGRIVKISDETGQAYAYGMGGGDPSAFFSLSINDKPIYFKAKWYDGYGQNRTLRSAIIIDDKKLFSCIGPSDWKQDEISQFEVDESRCVDESKRFSARLENEELAAYNRAHTIEAYVPTSLDKEICDFFGDGKNLKGQMADVSDKRFQFIDPAIQSEKVFFGRMARAKIDMNNDGREDAVYKIYGYAGYFDGNYFVFFDEAKDEQDFTMCVFSGQCPEAIKNNMRQNVEYAVDNINSLWPSAQVISAHSLKDKSGKEYRARYTYIYPVVAQNKTYLYFKPLNTNVHPAGIVALLNTEGKFEEICTYKDVSNGRPH